MAITIRKPLLAAVLALSAGAPAEADDVLFENVRIFDGRSALLSEPANVLVRGNVIETISTEPLEAEGARLVAGGGRTLMPGLIDAH
jgi:imidazolonepropionase-like amidohydrolase